ncbi:MAG: prolyl oligopeptidase family serine peptidase [Haloferacaceae archaeon]
MAQYSVSRYLSVDQFHGPSFGPGGERVAVLGDTTGTPQVWVTDEADAWPERLTGYEERISTVDWSPAREEFVFAMDEGSDEYDQLFLYERGDGTITPLTAMPDAKHEWGGWAPDGDRFAFTSTRRTGGSFDAYVQSRDERGDEATMVYEGEERLSMLAWDGDGERLVVREDHSSYDHDLHLVDVAAGDSRPLTDDGTAAQYDSVAFAAGGDHLYLTTDRGSDTAYLGRLALESGDVETVVEGGDWDVEAAAYHADSGTVVYARNVDGYADVGVGTVSGADFEEAPAPDLDGHVLDRDGLALSPDGERYALILSRYDEPHGLYVGDVETGGLEQWTRAGTLGVPRSSFRDCEVVRYETFDGREIPAYWTLPEGAEPGETPVIVDIHGGPEYQRRPWFYPEKQYFLNRGYAVFEPNVRGSSGYGAAYGHLDDREKRLDAVRDVNHAVEWLGQNEYVDEDRVVAYGRSYGGFMVVAAITQYPELWAAAVEFVGLVNFETFLENTSEWRRGHRAAEYGSLDDRELLREISPIHDVDRVRCPLMVLHGANDPRVPISESEQVLETAREAGVETERVFFDDEGHHFTKRANQIEAFERVSAFLDDHV